MQLRWGVRGCFGRGIIRPLELVARRSPEMPSELNFKPAHELARLIRTKELSPVELMHACLDRIDETEPTLNAWCGMRREEAMEEARELEGRIARGEEVGPMAGLPFGVKELDDLAGFPSTHASVPFKD